MSKSEKRVVISEIERRLPRCLSISLLAFRFSLFDFRFLPS